MGTLYDFARKSTRALGVLFAMIVFIASASAQYITKNLVSDLAKLAPRTDPNLINAWGIAYPPTGPFWISAAETGVSTLYYGNGRPFPSASTQLIVTIPPPAGSPAGTKGASTGIVFNGTSDFAVSEGGVSGPARFIFVTEDGTISGWSPGVNRTNAILAVDNSANAADGFGLGADYKGLAIGNNGSDNFIYAANFRDGVVEMYDANFHFTGAFTDPDITPDAAEPGFAPFGIQAINGQLYVTFAMQDEDREDDVEGPGNGFIDVFGLDGAFIKRFATGGTLNSPWGLTMAPVNFGPFSNRLLVGNFGDGRINAFDSDTGGFLGQLPDNHGTPISIEGLWGLIFGNGATAGPTNILFFTAGPDDEEHGVFGRIQLGT